MRSRSSSPAILHVQRAAADGGAHCWGNLGVSAEAALASLGVKEHRWAAPVDYGY